MNSIFVLIFAFFCCAVEGSRILFLFPSFSKSHVIIAQSLSEELATRGHNVTVVSPFPMKKNVENLREIKCPIPEEYEIFASKSMSGNASRLEFMMQMGAVLDMGVKSSELMTETPEFKEILNENFDLMIIGFFMNEMLLGYGHHFKCPTMMLSANAAMTFMNRMFGNPLEVNAVPHMMMQQKGEMTFFKRVGAFVAYGMDLLMATYFAHRERLFYE